MQIKFYINAISLAVSNRTLQHPGGQSDNYGMFFSYISW